MSKILFSCRTVGVEAAWPATLNTRIILLFSGLAMLSACSEPPGQYKLGLHDAYQRLVKGDFNDFKIERHCGILINIASQGQGGRAVTWNVTSRGRRMLSTR